MKPEDCLSRIEARLGAELLSRRPEDLSHFGQDWSGQIEPRPCAVAFPRGTQEVSALVRICAEAKLPIVPSGGRTGLSGGATAASGELVLSLSKMNRMDPVDRAVRIVRVQAGAVTQAVHEHCLKDGLTWPVDFASKGSSQVGGNLATNAGGVRVIRYGSARSWVQSIELVLASGDILELNGELEKNNTGYDLRNLVVGSEGTLGVITEATLKLAPPPEATQVFFFGLDGMEAVSRLFAEVRDQALPVLAFECLSGACYEIALGALGLGDGPVPRGEGAYVLLELENADVAELEPWLESLYERKFVLSGTLAGSPTRAQELWRIREGVAESIMKDGLVHQHDVSVPIARLPEFSEAITKCYAKNFAELEVFIFGHIGDGNLHIFIRKPPTLDKEAFNQRCAASDGALFELIRDFKGSISAEHGIGILKREALPYCRGPIELEILRGIKRAFDPMGIMNPGKIFEAR